MRRTFLLKGTVLQAPPLIVMIPENNPVNFQDPSWSPHHLSQWKTTSLAHSRCLWNVCLNWWPLIIKLQKYFSKYFSCDYTMHTFQGFQVNLQHIEVIRKKTSQHNWNAHGESDYLKEAMITSTLCCGRVNATWHRKNALPSAITTDENISGYHMNGYVHITSRK